MITKQCFMRSLVLSMMDIFIVKINYQPVKLNDHQGLTAFSIPMGLQFFVFYMLPNLPFWRSIFSFFQLFWLMHSTDIIVAAHRSACRSQREQPFVEEFLRHANPASRTWKKKFRCQMLVEISITFPFTIIQLERTRLP